MTRRVWLGTGLLVIALAAPAAAQTRAGVRAGVSADPDQFFFGGHVESAPVAGRMVFRPGVEAGRGSGQTLIAFNVEFAWRNRLSGPWSVYFLGGPAANLRTRTGRDSDVGGGINVGVGFEHDRGLFTELKVGAIDSPGVKFTVGYVFR